MPTSDLEMNPIDDSFETPEQKEQRLAREKKMKDFVRKWEKQATVTRTKYGDDNE